MHPRGDAQPLRTRPRGRSRRSARRPRRVHGRDRTHDRCRGAERSHLPQQRLARHLRRCRSAARLPGREAAYALRDRRGRLAGSQQAAALDLLDDLGCVHADPAVVLVSNNPYALDRPLVRGTRPTLASGLLGILVLDRPSEGGRTPGRAWSAPRLELEAEQTVHAGIDGEAVELEPPLHFAMRPSALHVRISRRHPGVSPSGRLRSPGATPRSLTG